MELETRPNGAFRIHQKSFAKKIQLLPMNCSFSDFRSKHQELGWLVHTRPDLACAVSVAAQVSETTFGESDIQGINEALSAASRHNHRALTKQKLDLEKLEIVVYTDATFSANLDYTSQLGYLILLFDATGKCNILHYSSSNSKRVPQSVPGSEIYVFVDGFDFAFCVKKDLENILSRPIPMAMLTDSQCLFDVITRSSTCREKRLTIDIAVVKEVYDRQEITQAGHACSDQNPADGLTKINKYQALNATLDTGKLELDVNQWVLRQKRNPIKRVREVRLSLS